MSALKRLHQVMAAFLVPVFLIVGMQLIPVVYVTMMQLFGAQNGGVWATMFGMLGTIIASGLFVGLCIFCYHFVRTAGLGMWGDVDED